MQIFENFFLWTLLTSNSFDVATFQCASIACLTFWYAAVTNEEQPVSDTHTYAPPYGKFNAMLLRLRCLPGGYFQKFLHQPSRAVPIKAAACVKFRHRRRAKNAYQTPMKRNAAVATTTIVASVSLLRLRRFQRCCCCCRCNEMLHARDS